MLVHDNGKLNVLCANKCGHVAMTYYFGMQRPGYPTFGDWLSLPSPKIVVIRHPVERMWAAINWYNGVFDSKIKEYERTGKTEHYYDIKPFLNDPYNVERYIFDEHCRPYLKIIKNRDFRIIKFEELGKYIPKITRFETKTRNRDIEPFPPNRYFNKTDMLHELEAYEEIIANREVISPEEWKELTS